MEDRAHEDADPINPQRVFWELSSRLPDGAILAADSGSAANWFARDLKLRSGMMATLSGTLATMGCGVPYAIAAKFAHPDRPAIALVGDGAMQMNGLNELITVAKYWQRWSDPRLVVLVLNNRDLNQVTWEQRALQGDPMYPATQEIPDFPYARFGELVGLRGIRVDDPDQIGRGLGLRALGRPARGARGGRRPRGAAAAAAHQLRPGQALRPGRALGRPAARADDPPVAPADGRSAHAREMSGAGMRFGRSG